MSLDPLKRRLIYLDFETFYDDDYSLKNMPTPCYILDDRFENILCAVREDDNPAYIVDGADFPKWIADAQPTRPVTTTVTFNALFDNSILAWRYGYVPDRMADAMGMARALRGHKLTHFSLAHVGAHLGIGTKGDTLAKVKGMHAADIKRAGLWGQFCQYALTDTDICAGIFKQLIHEFPEAERRIMDLTLRAAVLPSFHVDKWTLVRHIEALREQKAKLLSDAGVSVDQLMSSNQFAAALQAAGVTVQYKENAAGKLIPALAKTDEFMHELSEHPDPTVQALHAARVGHKSTLEETRALKFLKVGMLKWADYRDGNEAAMPVPLKYGGAHTHRLSGDWGMNPQNLTRGSPIRRALIAPPGYSVVVADLSQIEARMVAWLCGQLDLLEQFRNKKDPYSILASEIFGRPINRKLASDVVEGFIGKTGVLGLGYGCGKAKFYNMVLKDSRKFGIRMADGFWTPELAALAVKTYRKRNYYIQTAWTVLDGIVAGVWLKGSNACKFGPCTISKGMVMGPHGLAMHYANMDSGIVTTPAKTPLDDPWTHMQYTYTYGRERHIMYGAKLLENISQFLSRIITMNAALRLNDRGYRFVQQAHDELVFIVPNSDLDNAKRIVLEEMIRTPSWAPNFPLAAEVGHGPSYGEAK